jgi:hypothetical protein
MVEQLSLASQAAGAHPCPHGELFEPGTRPRDQDVRGILALGDGRDVEAGGQVGRDILHAVDGQVHPMIQQGLLDLLDEEGLAPHLGQRHVQDPVARRLDRL